MNLPETNDTDPLDGHVPTPSAGSAEAADAPTGGDPELRLVGIGSSAGGLDALKLLIAELPRNAGFCYLIAQHLSPYHNSILTQILERDGSHLSFETARSGVRPRAQTVYITPPNHDLLMRNGELVLTPPSHEVGPKPSVDQLLISMAEEVGDKAIAIILSGTGSDGTVGLRAIKAHGGLTFVQSPESAKYDGMPVAAIQAGYADHVLTPGEIARYLGRLAMGGRLSRLKPDASPDAIATLLELVNTKHRVDFSQYKDGTIHRQVSRRLDALQLDSVKDYLAAVRNSPDELDRLYQSFLISVTSFFRDPDAWKALSRALEERISASSPGDVLRVWVAGCATGEEAYSVAILLSELMASQGRDRDFKVFATDIDDRALEFARQGVFPAAQVGKQITGDRMRYFVRQGSYYRVVKALRESIVFARHNLADDPPFSSLDLICCRNLFIYLVPSLQTHLLHVFQHALVSDGLLFTGQSETIDDPVRFRPIESTRGLYLSHGERRPLRVDRNGRWAQRSLPIPIRRLASPGRKSTTDRAREMIIAQYAPAGVLVDDRLHALHFFGPVKDLLEISDGSADLGLSALLPPELRVPVRALVHRAGKAGAEASLVLRRARPGPLDALRCVVRPLSGDDPARNYFLVHFEPAPSPAMPAVLPVAEGDAASSLLIGTLERELGETRESLQSVIEQIEVSNEELQSLNEEMQAGAEELQASNEELQTTNEELQSTNEELQTVNEELQVRTTELSSANSYMENLQLAIDLALIVVDAEFRIMRFSPSATRLFELLPTDVGRPLSTVRSAIDHEQLEKNIETVIGNVRPYSESLVRDGRSWLMRINPYFDGSRSVSGAVLTFTDITELSSARHDLAIHAAALEASADGMCIVDARLPDMPIVYATTAFSKLTGYARADIIGQNCRFLQGPDTDPQAVERIRQAIAARRQLVVELVNYRKDGTRFWCELRLSPVFDGKDQLTHYVGTQCDVTERRKAQEAVHHRANYDALTGLVNRASLLTRLQRILESAKKRGESTYLMFIDLDGFKEINDTLGHGPGDEVLMQTAQRLSSCVRENDVIARLGGDEFVIVFPEVPGLDVMMRLANSVLSRMREPFALRAGSHRLSASIGISAFPVDATDAEALIQHADTAMYRAKSNGRNGFAFYQAAMNEEAANRSSTRQAIFEAMQAKQFRLVYQPIIDLGSGLVVGAETLLRWKHPQNGLVLPEVFMPIAEDTGQIVSLGNWVLQTAAKQLHNWARKLHPEFRLAVNLSPRQLGDETFPSTLAGLPNSILERLDFEITESALLDKNPQVLESLEAIRTRGVRLTVDDFGTGHSSLQALLDFQIDSLKIDRRFLAADLDDQRNAALVQAIFSLASSLGTGTVAEGIESARQLNFVQTLGCKRAQGFMFAKPLNIDAFEAFYVKNQQSAQGARQDKTAMH